MATPWHHSVSSSKRYGGRPEDYLPVHHWFDETKSQFADFRHRALRHHSMGIFECEKVFGVTITVHLANGQTKQVPTRLIGEQHVKEDCGFIPTVADWLRHLKPERWMGNPPVKLERELLKEDPQLPAVTGELMEGVQSGRETAFI